LCPLQSFVAGHPSRESHRPGQSDLAEAWFRSRRPQPKTIRTRPIATNEQTIKTPSHNSLLAMALLRAENLMLCLPIGRKKGNLNLLRFQGKRFVRGAGLRSRASEPHSGRDQNTCPNQNSSRQRLGNGLRADRWESLIEERYRECNVGRDERVA